MKRKTDNEDKKDDGDDDEDTHKKTKMKTKNFDLIIYVFPSFHFCSLNKFVVSLSLSSFAFLNVSTHFGMFSNL